MAARVLVWLGGARMAFGSDGGVYPHGDNGKQFAYMVEYGMKPIEAIRAATVEAAELMGWAGQAGVVEAGAWADIIAVQGDVLKDVSLLEKVGFVMKGGKVFKHTWRK